MSEIRNRVEQRLKDLIKDVDPEFAEDETDLDVLVYQILSIPELAIVDREAELSEVKEDSPFVRLMNKLRCSKQAG